MSTNLFVMVYNEGKKIKAFSSKYLLLQHYREIHKFYSKYNRIWRENAVNTINNSEIFDRHVYADSSDEDQDETLKTRRIEAEARRQDLLNFIQNKEYEGIFSFEELKIADPSFDFHFVTVNSESFLETILD